MRTCASSFAASDFERTARFCEIYDNPAFDPGNGMRAAGVLDPLLRRVFAFPKNSIYKTPAH